MSHSISPEEFTIIQSVAQGHTNATIAKQMRVETTTLKNRMVKIFNKCGVDSRLQLTIWFIEREQRNDATRSKTKLQ